MENKPPVVPTNEEISENDDAMAAYLVRQCRDVMERTPTVTKMKVCYNLTAGCLKLFCVQGTKKHIIALVDAFHKGLIDQINESFDGR